MLSPLALALLAAAPLVAAHGQVSWVSVGGQQYPAWTLDDYYTAEYREQDPVYGQIPETKYTRKTEALDLGWAEITSNNIATGGYDVCTRFDDMSPVGTINANAGDEVVVQWDQWPTTGHPGPIGEMMAKCPNDNCSKVDATTLDWFSIAQHNYDADTQQWPTDVLGANGLQWSFNLPTDLPSGAYILRHELIALHEEYKPQHYPIAMEIKLSSSGSNLPSLTCKFPACFGSSDWEEQHSIWDGDLTLWQFPGIGVHSGGYTTGVVNGASASSGSSSGSDSSDSSSSVNSSSAVSSQASTASASPTSTQSSGVISVGASVGVSLGAVSTSLGAQAATSTSGKTCKKNRKRNTVAKRSAGIPKRHLHRQAAYLQAKRA
ncbi:hypothetical protein L202_01274 [Cryptococcus amylolentus CBS 6039]|uniref:lytic cellulose monooxygenase (C4-dehydrogenating) n=1 Tax=Cryptococcus amylolentus CBS 6039 TaxID=1295533 RepID=A0A1E3I3C9_9TREE|nr:hypothetical protein L202_01274 [Cryptococcus amylolentus CBS 6039]ODN83049.1 hypothetical protein L202_01274 [Cryptococcus amylolentus CBS 6039]